MTSDIVSIVSSYCTSMVPSSSVDKYLFLKCGRGRGGLRKLLPNPAGEETTPFADGHYVYMEDLRKSGPRSVCVRVFTS